MFRSHRDLQQSVAQRSNVAVMIAGVSTELLLTAVLPDLYRLRAFLVIAEELNVRRAAARLNMTQSPLSRLIKRLEDEIGTPLFVRTYRGVRLTMAGRRLVPQARSLLSSATALVSEFRGTRTGARNIA